MLKLYDYFRSSASYRVRIALNLKGLDYEQQSIDLRGGQQSQIEYKNLNPQGLVPCLLDGDNLIAQSMAICEYLEETYPQKALLPKTPNERARVRSLALSIACDIHPLNNLRVLNYLIGPLQKDDATKITWMQHWVALGFAGLESQLQQRDDFYCHGEQPGLADVFLIPQIYNAKRVNCPLDDYPKLLEIEQRCNKLPAFIKAAPENQTDAA